MFKLFFNSCLFILFNVYAESFVTYNFGGRLGDALLAYSHGLYVAYKNNIPLVVEPFRYMDKLELGKDIKVKDLEMNTEWILNENINEKGIIKIKKNNTIHVIPYFSEFKCERKLHPEWLPIKICWEDENFKAVLKKKISLIKNINLIYPPKSKLSIALHLRRGGSFDAPLISEQNRDEIKSNVIYADRTRALKFPPRYFYVDSLKFVTKKFFNRDLYVFIFTDDHNPQEYKSFFEKAFKEDKNVEFDCRNSSHEDSCVLEDFFSLLNFNILIRSESNFSFMASKLKNSISRYIPKKDIGKT